MAAKPRMVTLETTTGPIGIELYWDHAPKTCSNFYELVRSLDMVVVVVQRLISFRVPPWHHAS